MTLDDVLVERLERLADEPRRLLEVVAVAGRPISEQVVRRAAGLGVEESAALAALRAGHLVRVRGASDGDEVEMFHDRFRALIVARSAAERIRDCHARLASSLEASGRGNPEALVEHYKGAGNLAAAGRHALAAADHAQRALAFDRAANLFRLALELRAADDPERHTLSGKLADALANAGRSAEAAAMYLVASAAANPETESALRVEWDRRAAEQFLISGHIDDGLRVIDQVLATVGLRMAKTPRRALFSLALRRARLRLRGLEFRERAAAGVPAAQLLRVDVCWAVARGLGMVDNVRATDFQTLHLLLALDAGEPYRIARGLAMDVAFMSGPGGPNRAAAVARSERAQALASRVAHPHAVALATLTAGMASYLVGDFARALAQCEEAEVMLRERCTGVAWELASAHRFIMGSLMYLGDLRDVRRRVLVHLQAAREHGNLYAATDIRTRFNIAWLVADQPAEARRQHDEAMAEWSNTGFHLQHYSSLLALVQLALYRRDGDEARRTLARQWPLLERSMLMRIQFLRVEAVHLRARGTLAAPHDNDASARRAALASVEADARRLERERMPWCAPFAPLLRAAVASRRGDRAAAATLLRTSIQGFDAQGLRLYAAAARRRLGELEGDRAAADSAAATHYFATQEVGDPAAMVDMLAPGFAPSL